MPGAGEESALETWSPLHTCTTSVLQVLERLGFTLGLR